MDEETLEWEALEYKERERSADWFWALGIIAVASATAAILYKDYLFAAIIIIAAIMMSFLAVRPPQNVSFRINAKGIEIGKEKHSYKELTSFFILEKENGENILLIMSDRAVAPLISIPLADESPSYVRELLLKYLPEENHREPTAHKIMEYLGF